MLLFGHYKGNKKAEQGQKKCHSAILFLDEMFLTVLSTFSFINATQKAKQLLCLLLGPCLAHNVP